MRRGRGNINGLVQDDSQYRPGLPTTQTPTEPTVYGVTMATSTTTIELKGPMGLLMNRPSGKNIFLLKMQ